MIWQLNYYCYCLNILLSMFKCLVFALVLASVCTYKGYSARGGAKGVGRAVVSTAVFTMVGIVVSDWITSLLSETVLNLFLENKI